MEARRRPESAAETIAQRREEAKARLLDDIQTLRRSAAMLRHRHTADVLQKLILSGKRFVFDTAAQLFAPQPWAIDDAGALLGHLLTIDDLVFEHVAEDCSVEVLTMPEAFDRTWADLEQRSAWVAAYAEALRGLADREEQRDRAVRLEHDLRQSVPEPGKQT